MFRPLVVLALSALTLSACGGGDASLDRDVPNNIAISQIKAPDGMNRVVRMENASGGNIIGVMVRPTGQVTWSPDIFRLDWLQDESHVNINMDDGSGLCTYDFLVQRHPAGEVIFYEQNVCNVSVPLVVR
jgi:hypothetical protein